MAQLVNCPECGRYTLKSQINSYNEIGCSNCNEKIRHVLTGKRIIRELGCAEEDVERLELEYEKWLKRD